MDFSSVFKLLFRKTGLQYFHERFFMNYFDDLHITSCGIAPDDGNSRIPPTGFRETSTELNCPVCPQMRCQAGRGGSVSIGIIHGNTFWRQADRCREISRPFVYWLRDNEYFAWCNPRKAMRENRWIVFRGERSGRVLEALDELAEFSMRPRGQPSYLQNPWRMPAGKLSESRYHFR